MPYKRSGTCGRPFEWSVRRGDAAIRGARSYPGRAGSIAAPRACTTPHGWPHDHQLGVHEECEKHQTSTEVVGRACAVPKGRFAYTSGILIILECDEMQLRPFIAAKRGTLNVSSCTSTEARKQGPRYVDVPWTSNRRIDVQSRSNRRIDARS
jgi:hypothetical protein